MPLDAAGAGRAMDDSSPSRSVSGATSAAAGVVRLADVKMALAVRSITTERGLDPRDYTLVAYGGGGPLHAVAIARELGIPRVIIPPAPSTFSAWGMLATDLRHDLVRTVLEPLERTDGAWAEARYGRWSARSRPSCRRSAHPVTHRAADLRYLGQEHTVTVRSDGPRGLGAAAPPFDAAHERAYGYAARRRGGAAPQPAAGGRVIRSSGRALPALPPRRAGAPRLRDAQDLLHARSATCSSTACSGATRLRAGDVIEGPAAIEEAGTTTMLEPGDGSRSRTMPAW